MGAIPTAAPRAGPPDDKAARLPANGRHGLLLAVLDACGDAVLIHDRGFNVVDVNGVACERYGYTRAEFTALTYASLEVGAEAGRPPDFAERLARDGQVVLETTHRAKDGREIPTELNIRTVRHHGVDYVACICRDIAARLAAQAALRESETKLRAVFETSRDAIGVSKGGVHVFVYPAYLRMFGYGSGGELAGRSILDLIAPGARPEIVDKIKRRARGEAIPDIYETVGLRKDGGEFDMEVSGSSYALGQDLFTLVILRDISERKRIETALRVSEEKFAKAFHTSPDAVNLNRLRDGLYLEVNEGFTALTGYTAADVAGRTSLELSLWANPADRDRLVSGLRTAGVVTNLETVFRVKDGTTRTCLMSARVIPIGGEPCILSITRDISERKHAEEERVNLERQMLHVQKLESLGVLAGGIAHDFNNLLVSVLGHADLALAGLSLASPAHESVTEIEKAARRAADLTKQMLAYSGKGRFVVRALDLRAVVEDMASLLRVSVSKKAALRFDLAADLPAIVVDDTQVRQVLVNLVINASEAIGDGSGVITVRAGVTHCDRASLATAWLDERLPEGPYVFLEVSDTGCGMDPATLARVFDPFFTTKFTGRGLGLAAVLGIVRGHKGTVKVRSVPGGGSTFTVLFPASVRPADRLPAPPTIPAVWRGRGTVLLVDDEDGVRVVGRKMLEQLGFDVEVARDGREGVSLVTSRPDAYVCILLDLTMPNLDGEETFREMRCVRGDLPVVLSSGYSEQDIALRFSGVGLAGFIQKPYKMADLARVLGGVVAKVPDSR